MRSPQSTSTAFFQFRQFRILLLCLIMNSAEFFSSTCRICLQDGATYSIFEGSAKELAKLRKCFMEKIEDMEGYPRSICSSCKSTLDLLSEFIDKYRKNCEILKETIAKVKTEVEDDYIENSENFWDNQEYSFIKVEHSTEENTVCDSNDILEKLKPLPGLKITKVESEKCLKRKYSKTDQKKTSKIASSIIESELDCNGDELRRPKISKPSRNSTEKKIKTRAHKNSTKLVEIKEEQNTESSSVPCSVLCDYCGTNFKEKKILKNHIESHHIMKRPVTCKICLKIYPSDKGLKLHHKRCHTEKTLQCEQCPKMFTTLDLLHNHIKQTHNKHLFSRIYSCKFCDKKYKSHYCYLAHERSVHTGLRPEVCKICNKAFYHRLYLREHMRIHTGELPYKCPFCDRGCTILSNLKSHLRTHKKSELDGTIMSKMKPGYFKFLKNC